MIAPAFWLSVVTIGYVYVGYPLLLAVVGPLAGRRPSSSPTNIDLRNDELISCIVPALDEEANIVAKVANLIEELEGRRFEVIVVDDGSRDRTRARALAVDDERVRVVGHDHRRGKPSALNTGVACSNGSTLVFSDADVLLSSGSLKAMLARFADADVGIVGAGRLLSGAGDGLAESEGLYWRYEQFIQSRESELGACTAMSGALLVMDRTIFAPLPIDVINDDFYLTMQVLRRGRLAVHEPSATAVVGVAADAAAERGRRSRIVAGRWQAVARATSYLPWRRAIPMWEVTSHKLLRPIVPFAFGLAMMAAAAALTPGRASGRLVSLRGPARGIPLLVQILFLVAARLGSKRQEHGDAARDGGGLAAGALAVPAFLVSSNRAAVSGTIGFITGSQTARWKRSPSPHLTSMSDAGSPGGKR